MKKLFLSLLLTAVAVSSHANVLLQDSLNYPYTNGCIEGQGQWFCYSPTTPVLDADVTNNVLYLNATNKDSVATPTNGFYASTNGTITFCSFTINVSQLPATANGGYFFQFQDVSNNNVCHIFIDTRDTVVPGTYRLGIANFASSFTAAQPPLNYPMDLATGVTYTVVCAYDTDQGAPTVGANLWINPSTDDYTNDLYGTGEGYIYGTDATTIPALLNIQIAQVAFSPYATAGISNVLVGTQFTDVLTTNLPVFGVQPQPQTNYSGNSTAFYSAASGVDLNYQWYSTSSGLLHDDGVNISGSTSNVLTLNNLSASDTYYVVATDVYGNQATSASAANTVITTPTPVFFPTNELSVNLTNNLFTSVGFTNAALGTGPISYQWYFAPTNTPNTYSPLPGQTSPTINLSLSDYSFAGNYYVAASDAVGGGSIAYGPTNSLAELAPLQATLFQLHNLELSELTQVLANKFGTVNVSTNNLVVGGYVSTYFNVGSSYTEYFIQDTNGYGTEVYLPVGTTNVPPIGSYVTVTGPLAIYHTGLEMEPAAISSITTNLSAPTFAIPPVLANANFYTFSTNALGTNALLQSCAMVTFTNVYLYGFTNGAAFGLNGSHSGVGGVFASNTYTALYCTVGTPYGPGHTNVLEVFQPAYNIGTAATQITPNPIAGLPIPTFCAQLTGVYLAYGGQSEVIPSRPSDYVVTAPALASSIQRIKKTVTLNWPQQAGSTYSVYSATNLGGPWIAKAYGLNYYPTNITYVETNTANAQFYKVTSP